MSQEATLLHCYNRACGKKFDPNNNKEDDCIYHPGHPIFHDGYKEWSCCNKRCVDFTEFLNVKGCTKSCHSHKKPPEPEKPVIDKSKVNEVIEVIAQPLNNGSTLKRPPFDSPQVTLIPNVSPALLKEVETLTSVTNNKDDNSISIGQICKNNSCTAVYAGTSCDDEVCNYHHGVPVFHEGMKYWSCCQKKTTDFSKFLTQPGCVTGKHNWLSQDTNKKIECRMDWHQTATFIVISVYAKKYSASQSTVKLNPIHLTVNLFHLEGNFKYNLDLELRGVVDVTESSVNMLPTKVEIKLKKAEPGSWAKLDFPRVSAPETQKKIENDEIISEKVEAIDLTDL